MPICPSISVHDILVKLVETFPNKNLGQTIAVVLPTWLMSQTGSSSSNLFMTLVVSSDIMPLIQCQYWIYYISNNTLIVPKHICWSSNGNSHHVQLIMHGTVHLHCNHKINKLRSKCAWLHSILSLWVPLHCPTIQINHDSYCWSSSSKASFMCSITVDVGLNFISQWFWSPWRNRFLCIWIKLFPVCIFLPIKWCPVTIQWVKHNFGLQMPLHISKDTKHCCHMSLMRSILEPCRKRNWLC